MHTQNHAYIIIHAYTYICTYVRIRRRIICLTTIAANWYVYARMHACKYVLSMCVRSKGESDNGTDVVMHVLGVLREVGSVCSTGMGGLSRGMIK
jgi:hypothetical protein